MFRILLVCGTGASSGFMAKCMRQAAKSRKLEISIKARSDAEVTNYVKEIDLLLVGPHLEYLVNDLKKITDPYHVPVEVIPQNIYGSLDGDKLLDFSIEKIGGEK